MCHRQVKLSTQSKAPREEEEVTRRNYNHNVTKQSTLSLSLSLSLSTGVIDSLKTAIKQNSTDTEHHALQHIVCLK